MADRNSAHRSIGVPKGLLDGASVLVTGGTGSFGKAFIKRVLAHYSPAKLIVLSRDEPDERIFTSDRDR